MTLLDGKKLSQKILDEIRQEVSKATKAAEKLRLAVVVVGNDPVVMKFIEQKKKTAELIGIDVRVYDFDEKITTNELRKRLAEIVHEKANAGVIIQLPLPEHINAQYILNAIPPEKDVDMLSAKSIGNFAAGLGRASPAALGKSQIMPPVVGAVKAFFEEYKIDYKDKYIVVVGAGKLVGKPVATWLTNEGATVSVVNEFTKDIAEFTKKADIIISGVGKPKLIIGDMVKNGVVVIDAGVSVGSPSTGQRQQASLVGDVDFDSVSQKASYITPVPGGIGPLTVAMLFLNLATLPKSRRK